MNCAILSLGSNSADRESQMTRCIAWLRENATLAKLSSVYNSPALNGKDSDYLNAVAEVQTSFELATFNTALKQYERQCGRTPQSKALGSIPIDIDIVMWNGEVLRPKDFAQYYFANGWNEINK